MRRSWHIDTTLTGPDGLRVTSDYIYSAAPTPGVLQVCTSLVDPGPFTVSASGEYWDDGLNQFISFELNPAHITLRLPRTKVSARSSKTHVAKGRRLKIVAHVRDERPNGFFPSRRAGVRLEEKLKGRWYWLRGTRKGTDSTGRATLTYVGRGKKTQLRVAVLSDGIYSPSVSKVLKIKTR